MHYLRACITLDSGWFRPPARWHQPSILEVSETVQSQVRALDVTNRVIFFCCVVFGVDNVFVCDVTAV